MARKIKIPNEVQKRYARQEQKRAVATRQIRLYYLIVCEGEQTEPNYFKALRDDLPNGVLTFYQIEVEGTGTNTMSLVEKALLLKAKYEEANRRKIDKLWTVFDRDSFPAQAFNGAIVQCQMTRPEIGCAWSNEAFELWYLLHFHYYNTAIVRKDYQNMIEHCLQPHIGTQYRYQKNSTEMYGLLKQLGNVELAIENGKRLAATYTGRQDYANHNPCTMVWKLVEELLALR